jgi:hypothetical protein
MRLTATKRDHEHRLSILSTAVVVALVIGRGQGAQADFILDSPPPLSTQIQAGGGTQSYSYIAFTPGVHTYSFNIGSGFSSTASAAVSASYAVTPTSFSATFNGQTSVQGSNSASSYNSNPFATFTTSAVAGMSNLTITIDTPSLVTITYDPGLNLGTPTGVATPNGNAIVGENLNAAFQILGNLGSSVNVFAEADQTYAQSFGVATTSYSETLTISGPPSFNATFGSGDTVSFVLEPDTYTIEADVSDAIAFEFGGIGTFNDPSSFGGATMAMDPIPEPASITLAGAALASIGGWCLARSYRRGKSGLGRA